MINLNPVSVLMIYKKRKILVKEHLFQKWEIGYEEVTKKPLYKHLCDKIG